MNNRILSITLSLLALLAILGGTSCGSKKTSYSPRDASWHTVSVPVKISLAKPAKISFSGKAFIVNDSLINISLRVLGMEVGVLNITRDSVLCLDKFHNYKIEESMSTITKSTGMTLPDIQDMLLGTGNLPSKIADNVTITTDSGEEGNIIPKAVNIETNWKGREISGSINYTPAKAVFNTAEMPRLKKPTNYKTITLPQLVEAMKDL